MSGSEIVIGGIGVIFGYLFVAFIGGVTELLLGYLERLGARTRMSLPFKLNLFFCLIFSVLMYFGLATVWMLLISLGTGDSRVVLGRLLLKTLVAGFAFFALINGRWLSRRRGEVSRKE